MPQNPEASAVFRILVFLKYGVTFRELVRQIDIEIDPAAHKKLMAVHRDFWQMKTGSRIQDMKLKFNWDHFDLIAQGLDFGFEILDASELAECLDEICACAKKHSPEYLKKLRARISRVCGQLL